MLKLIEPVEYNLDALPIIGAIPHEYKALSVGPRIVGRPVK
jgi:hypothetical protein